MHGCSAMSEASPQADPEAATIALDVHAHLVPLRPDDLAGLDGVAWDDAKGALVVDGHAIGIKPLYHPPALVDWMDRQRIATAWISAPPPLYRQHLDAGATLAWTDRLNAGLDRIAAAHPRRLAVLAHLPLHRPDVATAVASARLATGLHLFSAPAGGAGDLALSDPAYDPLWRALDAAAAFVFLHPGDCADGRLTRFYLSNLVGNPYETAVAIAHLVFGGVLERFPAIRFCFAHGGGVAAGLAGRFDQGFATARPGIDTARMAPRQLLRRLCVDCITHDDTALALSSEVFGADNIVFGSDWPFPMGLLEPHRQLAGLTRERRQAIFCDNPVALAKDRVKHEASA